MLRGMSDMPCPVQQDQRSQAKSANQTPSTGLRSVFVQTASAQARQAQKMMKMMA